VGEPSKTVLEASGIEGRVCVEFQQVDNRFTHEVYLLNGNERILVFSSFENPSLANLPCFTELHQQGKNLFLTGANGPCHWSMSVEVGEATPRGADDLPDKEKFLFAGRYGLNAPHRNTNVPAFQFLFFDVACRIKEDIRRLGTHYSMLDSVVYDCNFKASSGRISQPSNIDKSEMRFGANADGDTLRFDPEPKCLLAREESGLRIFSSEEAIKKYPATVQWSYGVWLC
jgi:hypothetical protein